MSLDEKGFTFIELLSAIVLMTIGMFAAVGMLSIAINANSFANKLSVASTVAHGVMEEIMAIEGSNYFFGEGTSQNTIVAANAVYKLAPGGAVSENLQGAGIATARYSITRNQPVTGVSTIIVSATIGSRVVRFVSYKKTE